MRKRYIIRVQSISDIITNSSSEVFVINTSSDQVEAAVEDILRVGEINLENGDDSYSGMGGDLNVYTWKNGFRKFKQIHERYRYDDTFTPQKWAEEIGIPFEELKTVILVDTDWSRDSTIEHIKTFYSAEVDDSYYCKYDFIDEFVNYDKDAPFNQDLEYYDDWEREYIENLRATGIPEKDIQQALNEVTNDNI